MRRRRSLTLGLSLGGCLLAAFCRGRAVEEKPPTPVRLQAAEIATAGAGTRYSANIVAKDQVALAFKQTGYLRDILRVRGVDGAPRDLHEGDRVERGTVLARLREDDFVQRVDEARSQLTEAEATLVSARQEFTRAEALYKTQSLTQPDYDTARRNLDVARARVDGAQAQLQVARTALDDCALRAPFAGVITTADLQVGQLVTLGTVGFVLADTTSVKAEFGVADVMLKEITLGGELAVNTESLPGVDLRGRITRIAPSADPKSRVFEVELTLPNRDGRLKPGMIAALRVGEAARAAGDGGATPAVRLSAIVRPPGDAQGFAVYLVQDDKGRPVARLRKVTLGQAFGNSIAVTSGLSPGERVIVTGATLVNDGDPVRIVP